MAEVPDELEPLVSALGSVKKKHFIVILRAAILDIEGATDEIDQEAVEDALNESEIEGDDQQEFIESCKFLLSEAASEEVSTQELSGKLKPLGFTPMHVKAIAASLDWARDRAAEPEEGDEDYAVEEDEDAGDGGASPAAAADDDDDDEEEQPTDEDGNDLLCNAVVEGDQDEVESLVEQGHSIDVRGTAADDEEDRELTPLMHAVVNNNDDMVQYLIDAGAKLSRVDRENGYTALHWSIATYAQGSKQATGHRKCLNILLEAKVSLEAVANDGNRALHLAAKERMADRVALLLHEKADVSAQNADGDTPLHLAVRLFDSASIPLLLEAGANPSQQNEVGDTSLHCATLNKDSLHCNMLIKRGADPNVANEAGDTSLHVSIRVMDAKCIQSVLDAGGDVTVSNAEGDTPLHVAAQNVSIRIVHLPPLTAYCASFSLTPQFLWLVRRMMSRQ
eukprot:COSAG01_NODE_200_length_22187_cov_59.140529_20_plen_451_part_00